MNTQSSNESPTRLCYMVITTLPDQAMADAYVHWLQDGHVDQVIKAGAHTGMIVRLDPSPDGKPRVMTQYIFSTQSTFDHYLQHHAPALRADGQKLFSSERGVIMQRLVGTIV